MNAYTVEAQMTPVSGDNWSQLRGVTDTVPGTILVEDPIEPLLILPVTADSPARAGMFVEGVFTLAGLKMVGATVTPADDDDDDVADASDDTSTEAQVRSWLDRVPSIPCTA